MPRPMCVAMYIGGLYHVSITRYRYLKAGEADQVGADTEAGTRAGRAADRRGVDIEDGEDGEGSQRNRADLIGAELLARQQPAGNRDGETLQGILN